MKNTLLLLFLIVTLNAFSQKEIMDSIEHIRSKKTHELANTLCTKAYWVTDIDGGSKVFEQICKWPPEVELKLNKEQKNGNRAVLTVDFYRNNVLRDRVYIYMERQSDSWLMDGFNETKGLIKHFLNGFYTGHFSPTDLPGDKDLENFGTEFVSFGQNEEALNNYLKQNTATGSESGFISQMVDNSFKTHTFESAGYDKRLNRGYIHFKGQDKEDDTYYSNITLYVSKNQDGQIKILEQNYSRPWASGFF